ncbi:MAG: CDP-diacylglycerol--glycerol-3-phosphate 3-phosphatidyltransferase [Syntrophobacterales bacterium]|nr:MAG: CDP-diacylglycerol--glycerol-3-phosphate 3-phosphatidyltransferase [Syntrophobacterales bacterium]
MNIPNLLTLLRIILVPVIVILLMRGSFLFALILFVAAGITDCLDGFLARVLNQQTVLGAYLDPLADKALIATSFVTLSILGIIPGWLVVIVISRDFIILFGFTILTLMSVSFEISPTYVSKATTVLQIVTIFLALCSMSMEISLDHGLIGVIFWLTALATIISGLYYIYIGIRLVNKT